MTKRIAIYPGTFDPITNGHIDIISRACMLFDEVIVLVAINPAKSPLFSGEERKELIRQSTSGLKNVQVDSYHGLIVDYAKEIKGVAIIRGLRAISDFEYELQLALMNRSMNEHVHTIFMAPHEKFTYLNSTIVKQVAKFGGDISHFVPDVVAKAIIKKYYK